MRRRHRRLREAVGRRFRARKGITLEVSRRGQGRYFGTEEFQLLQGCGHELRRIAAWSGAEINRRRIPVLFGEMALLMMTLLVVTHRLIPGAATGIGGNLLRRTAAQPMVAAALNPGIVPAQMRGNRVPLQQKNRHHLQNYGICGKCSLHIIPDRFPFSRAAILYGKQSENITIATLRVTADKIFARTYKTED